MPTLPPLSCMVIHCTDYRSDPQHEIRIPGGDGLCSAPVCAAHKQRIDQGEAWLWVPWQRLKAAGSDLSEGCLLMGEELAGYGLVVDVDIRMSNNLVLSSNLDGGQPMVTLAVDGRVFGVHAPVSLELVLTPETVARLKESLRFVQP